MMGGQTMVGRQKTSLPCITALKLDLELHLSDLATESDFVLCTHVDYGRPSESEQRCSSSSLSTILGHDTGIRTDHVYIQRHSLKSSPFRYARYVCTIATPKSTDALSNAYVHQSHLTQSRPWWAGRWLDRAISVPNELRL
jgi:hypothetical protein